MRIRPREAAQIGPTSDADAGDEEGHGCRIRGRRLRLGRRRKQRGGGEQGCQQMSHGRSSAVEFLPDWFRSIARNAKSAK
jgi:hypothetical protein